MSYSPSVLKTSIVGSQYHPGAREKLKELTHACPVLLVAEPNNEHDPLAVAVRAVDDYTHLGYIPRERAPIVRLGLINGDYFAAIDVKPPRLHILYHTKFQDF